MPYIKKETRKKIKKDTMIDKSNIMNAGELNYVFTEICKSYIERKGLCYQTLNDIIGALVGCLMELYRRKACDYEDKKIQENGDVY